MLYYPLFCLGDCHELMSHKFSVSTGVYRVVKLLIKSLSTWHAAQEYFSLLEFRFVLYTQRFCVSATILLLTQAALVSIRTCMAQFPAENIRAHTSSKCALTAENAYPNKVSRSIFISGVSWSFFALGELLSKLFWRISCI